MKSPVAKRSVVIGGRKTRVSLEEPFWSILKEIYLVLAECRLVVFEAELPQPTSHIHGGAPARPPRHDPNRERKSRVALFTTASVARSAAARTEAP